MTPIRPMPPIPVHHATVQPGALVRLRTTSSELGQIVEVLTNDRVAVLWASPDGEATHEIKNVTELRYSTSVDGLFDKQLSRQRVGAALDAIFEAVDAIARKR